MDGRVTLVMTESYLFGAAWSSVGSEVVMRWSGSGFARLTGSLRVRRTGPGGVEE